MPHTPLVRDVRRWAPWLLLVLPLLMTGLSLEFKRDQGPYWASNKADPSYPYLLGSLAYAVGKPSMCCLHPGVPVQINGAWVLRLSHVVIGHENFAADILRDPEVYAAILGFEEILLYAAAMFAAGWLIYRFTQRLDLALLMQTPVFFNDANFYWLSPIAPEAMLYALVILACALAVVYGLEPENVWIRRIVPVAFGLLSGVGVSAKITYLPGAVLPLILLDSWMGLTGYVLAAGASFAVISIPHWESVDNAIYFWKQLLQRQGLHGSGQAGHPQLAAIAAIFAEYIRSDPFFTAMFLACFIGTVWLLRSERGSPKRLLIALTVCELLQIALATRQFSLRYLSPAYALLAAHAVVIVYCLSGIGPLVRRVAAWACVAGVILLVAVRSETVHTTAVQMREQRRDSENIVRRILDKRPGSAEVAYYGANTIPFALDFGDSWVYRGFAKELEELYPSALFWDAYKRVFENFRAPVAVESLGDCGNLLLEGVPFGVHPMDFTPPDHVSVEELGRFHGEGFYAMTCGVTDAPPRVLRAPASPTSKNPGY